MPKMGFFSSSLEFGYGVLEGDEGFLKVIFCDDEGIS
jgi:hypothetical protein